MLLRLGRLRVWFDETEVNANRCAEGRRDLIHAGCGDSRLSRGDERRFDVGISVIDALAGFARVIKTYNNIGYKLL